MVRISKTARDLAEAIAQRLANNHSNGLPIGSFSVSQGNVIEQALTEYRDNHPDLWVADK